ncbi:MAG TPA: DUF2797 domain-containing protein [Bacteroidales bacterium]|nr:DUF2797 domain-containing protein [Bacteroidales bacterium]
MHISGNIRKMIASGSDGYVHYELPVGPGKLDMNDLLDTDIRIEYGNRINCIHCGRETKRSFMQGYCYPCFISLPQTDECILHPEKCRAHLGISRDMEWSETYCLRDHFVYLALSPGLKVGVTRESQVPVRWMDQGASEVIKLAVAPNRHLAGVIEVELKNHLADKTNWRNMLKGIDPAVEDLALEKERISDLLPDGLKKYLCTDNTVYRFSYPVNKYPEKVKTLNFEKDNNIEGKLAGIKGQYLIFDDGHVLNIRKFGGYYVDIYY